MILIFTYSSEYIYNDLSCNQQSTCLKLNNQHCFKQIQISLLHNSSFHSPKIIMQTHNFKNDKIFKFEDDDSDQDKSIFQPQQEQNNMPHQRQNILQQQYNNNQNYQTEKNHFKQSDQSGQKSKRSTAISMRRDRSFRVNSQKKLMTHNLQQNKTNASLYKSNNIFQWAQQSEESEKKNLIHETNKTQQISLKRNKQEDKKLQQHTFKLIEGKLKTNITGSSNLGLSNRSIMANSKLNFSDQFNIKLQISTKQAEKVMRKTANTESNPFKRNIRQIIQKKTLNPQTFQNIKKTRLIPTQILPLVQFSHKKLAKDKILMSRILVNLDGFNYFWPQFRLVQEKEGSLILSGKKKAANTTSNYYISISDKDIDVQNQNYCGKLRSNFLGSVFNIFSDGLNPQNYVKTQKSKMRSLLGTVTYQNTTGTTNPKSIKLYLLKPPYTYYDLQGTTKKEQQTSLAELYEIGQNKHKICVYQNRKPIFSKKQNKFVMNFDGRVKKPSTKNFILQDPITKAQVLMLGKIQEQQFVLHISHPLTPHIGLAVALAQLDSKIIVD